MPEGIEGVIRVGESPFELRSQRVNGHHRVAVRGEMDLAVIDRLDREIARVEDTDATKIVLELDELEFLDVAGVRLLLELSDRSRANGVSLSLTRSRSRQVRRVLDVTGAGDVLPFVD